MPFPLLRLPLLPFEAVVKTMKVKELFALSLCSKRMHLAVKNFRDKSIKLELGCEVVENIIVHLSEKKDVDVYFELIVQKMPDARQEGWGTSRFEETLFQEWGDMGSGWKSYWKDVEHGTRSLLVYVSDLFCTPIKVVLIGKNRFFWMFDWVEQRQGPRSYKADVYDRSTKFTDDQFRHLLIDLNPSKLCLDARPSAEFRFENFKKQYDTFRAMKGNWFTFENLFSIDCIKLDLGLMSNSFSGAEMNRFLRHVLIEKGAPRLTKFTAHVAWRDIDRILDGIENVLTPIRGRETPFEDYDVRVFRGMRGREGHFVSISISHSFVSPIVTLKIMKEA